MNSNPNTESGDPDPRVRFAAERTLLAWIRTGLAMMGFGFVVARLGLFLQEIAVARPEHPRHYRLSLWIGASLVLLGVFVQLHAAFAHSRFLADYEKGNPYHPPTRSLGIMVAVVLALLGIGMTVYLLLLNA